MEAAGLAQPTVLPLLLEVRAKHHSFGSLVTVGRRFRVWDDDVDDALDASSSKAPDGEVATLAIGIRVLVPWWENGWLIAHLRIPKYQCRELHQYIEEDAMTNEDESPHFTRKCMVEVRGGPAPVTHVLHEGRT